MTVAAYWKMPLLFAATAASLAIKSANDGTNVSHARKLPSLLVGI